MGGHVCLQHLSDIRKSACFIGLLVCSLAVCQPALAIETTPQQLVQQVVNNEIAADKNDRSRWMYRDADKTPTKNTVKLVVETDHGNVSKTIELNGQPLTPQQQNEDMAKTNKLVTDPSEQAKQRSSSQQDDKQANALMKMLPDAFIWTEAGRSNQEITLDFKPDPNFHPPTFASRVFAAMAGEMVIDEQQMRLISLRGTLIQPVTFGWGGIFGRLQQGGTFNVERREVAPHIWRIVQTHVHIQGHMLIFKSIGQQEDEESSHFKPSPTPLTLREAADMLNDGSVAKALGIAP